MLSYAYYSESEPSVLLTPRRNLTYYINYVDVEVAEGAAKMSMSRSLRRSTGSISLIFATCDHTLCRL